jgi:hypothetical protein
VWPRVTPTQRSRCPSRNRLAAQGVPPFYFLFLDPPAAGVPEGYSPYSGIPPAARAAAPTAETPNRMENGFASQRHREKI